MDVSGSESGWMWSNSKQNFIIVMVPFGGRSSPMEKLAWFLEEVGQFLSAREGALRETAKDAGRVDVAPFCGHLQVTDGLQQFRQQRSSTDR